MTTIRRINTSQLDGSNANNNNTNEIRPFGETAFYLDNIGNNDKMTLLMFDGFRTHLRSKVLAPGRLYGSDEDSSDQAGADTIKLIPDANLHYNGGNFGNDQYIKIEPTFPNHIHIRAGGTQDNSNAQLFIGGENSYFSVDDGVNPSLYIAANSSVWTFDGNGNLTIPSGGDIVMDSSSVSTINGVTSITFADASVQSTAWTGTVEYANVANVPAAYGNSNVTTLLSNLNSNSISTTGNLTANNLNITTIVFSDNTTMTTAAVGSSYGDSNVATLLGSFGSNNISTTGNVTAANFIGNISITGNVTGTSANVELVAGSYTSTFDNTGNVSLPGNLSVTGNISANVSGFAIGYRDVPQISFTGDATLAAADAGKHFYSTLSTANTLTIANNAVVSWPVGTAITIVNRGTGNITVAQGTGVSLYLAGNSTAASRTVTTYGMATLLNVATNVWMINGTGVS